MKKVKFNGSKWILITDNGGFFNPNSEVFFHTSSYSDCCGQIKMHQLAKQLGIKPEIGEVYEIPDSGIYTSVCGPQCGPFWPKPDCMHCGGKGVGACFSDGAINMGSTDEGNQEVENIKNGVSNIHPELNSDSVKIEQMKQPNNQP